MKKSIFEKDDDIFKSRLLIDPLNAEKKTVSDCRSESLHDRDRIIFSRSFRRLAGKTQVVTVSGIKTSDHIRSRLTHSLEVMQIATSIGNYLEEKTEVKKEEKTIDINLIEAISLGHDIGHTPYGHVGERALLDFFISDKTQEKLPMDNLKHSFQSLKVCCFLEKQYCPDFYGLNLTLATLDGILKHSKIKESDRVFYKKCFNSYYSVFMTATSNHIGINEKSYKKINELFDYCSPVTLEGTIVSIADEIAQVTHDIEDLRRLSSFNEMLTFYKDVENKLSNLRKQISEESEFIKIYDEFSKVLKDVEKNSSLVIKVERIYTKLILSLCIPTVGNLIYKLWDTEDKDSLSFLLKQYYTGSFEDLLKLSTHLSIEQNIKDKLQCLCYIFKAYEKIPMCMTDISRWDIKGKEMCLELANTMYDSLSLTQKSRMETEEKINLYIFKSDLRPHLKRSYLSGLKLGEELGLNDSESIAKKCLIWDYIAGMTDSFILKEYGSFSFKRVEL